MTFTPEQKQRYAAILSDAEYQVEMGLYPLPTNADELEQALQTLEKMPHSPEEKEQIQAILIREAKKILSEEEFSKRHESGIEPAQDEAEPVEITLDAQNYGLVYAAVQAEAEHLPVAELQPLAMVEGVSASETFKTAMEEFVAGILTTEQARELLDISPLTERMENLEKQLERLTPAEVSVSEVEALRNERDSLLAQVTETQSASQVALAETIALYWRLLRKPQARGKSQEQLVEGLREKGVEALSFLLECLREEYDTSDQSAFPQLNKLEDPTTGTEVNKTEAATPSPESPAAPTEQIDPAPEAPVLRTGDSTESIIAGELANDEEEVFYLLFPGLKS